MRLIKAQSLLTVDPPVFKEIFDSNDEEYIILSHRWGDDELTYQQVANHFIFWDQRIYLKAGYMKLQRMAKIAFEQYSIEWIWCDTCCIDKTNATELTEAINSMFTWYQDSRVCFAYLFDWPSPEVSVFTNSVWFTRCWTLQELIAPPKVVFYDCNWELRGNKLNLAEEISRRTRIDPAVLRAEQTLDRFSIAQRMSWTAGRIAARSEDEAYCLLGIFKVSMPMLYGEGRRAFVRLQEEIIQRNADQSIFVWFSQTPSKNLLASSPADFAYSGQIHQTPRLRSAFSLRNLGLEIGLELRQIRTNTYAAYLACEYREATNAVSLVLEYEPGTTYLCRTRSTLNQEPEQCSRELRKRRNVTILRNVPDTILTTRPIPSLYGFCLGGVCKSLLLINSYDHQHYWDHGTWQPDNRATRHSSPRYPIFVIPDGEAPSIASLILFLGKTKLLIHLMYDFDFRPCCYVSKHTHSVGYVFYLRSSGDSRSEEQMEWLDQTTGWTKDSSYMERDIVHPYTGEPGWAAKSLHRGGFTARLPRALMPRPYRDVDIVFSPHRESGDWIFDVKYEHVQGQTVLDLGFPVVEGSQDLQDVFMQYSHLGIEPSLTD